ncbi:hypothetical protein pb186bvf_009447 [Paramecium bursaria]
MLDQLFKINQINIQLFIIIKIKQSHQMYHRQSLGNIEPQNKNKEKIFDQPKRNRTPLQRQLPQIPFNYNPETNPMYNNWGDNEDDIIKFQTCPDLNLEQKNDFMDVFSQSTGYFGSVKERPNQVKNIILIAQQRDQVSKSPNNRIKKTSNTPIKTIQKSPIKNENPQKYKVSKCLLELEDAKSQNSYEQYIKLQVKISFLEEWICFAPDCHERNQICRISKQDELYILKGDNNNQSFDSQEQMAEKIKQHLIAQSLLKLYFSILKGYMLKLPQTQFQYSNILIFEKINASQFWIAQRKFNGPLITYNDTNGEIYKGSKNDIYSDFLNAFSYFTYKQSNHKFMILNIKCCGSQLTEPELMFISKRKVRDKFIQNFQDNQIGKQYYNYIEHHFDQLQKQKQ